MLHAGLFDDDPRAREQMVVGQLRERDGRTFFDTWTSFETRSFRTRKRLPAGPEMRLADYRIDATVHPDLRMEVVTRVTAVPSPAAANVFPPTPGTLCDWCGFNDLCEAYVARPR